MKEFEDSFLEEENEKDFSIDIGKYLKILKGHWKAVALWALGGFAVGCLFALATPHKFICTSKIAPELTNTATTRLTTMASMVGLSASMLGTTDAVYPMVYPDLVKSPEFVADLFDTPVHFVYKKEAVDTTLYSYLTEYKDGNFIAKVLGAPMTLVGKIVEKVKSKDGEDDDEEAPVDPFHFTKKQSMVYRALSKALKADIDKKTLVVTISTTMNDALVSAQVNRAVIDNLKKYVTKYRTEKSTIDADYYQMITDEAQAEYYAAQRAYSRYCDSHQNVTLQSVSIERIRLQNEAQMKFNLYSSCVQQLQNAQAKVQQETPVLAEVYTPTVPYKSANSRKKTALAWMMVGLAAGAVWVIAKKK